MDNKSWGWRLITGLLIINNPLWIKTFSRTQSVLICIAFMCINIEECSKTGWSRRNNKKRVLKRREKRREWWIIPRKHGKLIRKAWWRRPPCEGGDKIYTYQSQNPEGKGGGENRISPNQCHYVKQTIRDEKRKKGKRLVSLILDTLLLSITVRFISSYRT